MRAFVSLLSLLLLLLSGHAKESVVGMDVVGKAGGAVALFGVWRVLLLDEEGTGGEAGKSPSCCWSAMAAVVCVLVGNKKGM
jgi:hypothetical protein